MRQKACKHCGRVFIPASKYTYLCPECHDKAKASGVVLQRVCRQCGATFFGGPRAWYCPNCRVDRVKAQEREHKRSGPVRAIGSTDLCAACGGEYIVNSGRQKYCPACSGKAVNEAIRNHKRQYAANRKEQIADYKTAMSSNRHVCVVCGKIFDSNLPTVTCSDACDAVRRKNHQRAADAKRSPRKRSVNSGQ